ncbi:MAG: hypothetical protein V4616_14880 [Bacteroidota bacterium]
MWYRVIYYPSWCRLDGLLAGISIAAIYRFLPDFRDRLLKFGNLALLISLGLLTGAYYLCYDPHEYGASVYGFPLIAVGFGLMVIAALSPSCVLYRVKSRITQQLAILSYAIYLSHKGVVHCTQLLSEPLNLDVDGNVMLVLCTIASVGVALLMHHLVEKPGMRLRSFILRSSHHPLHAGYAASDEPPVQRKQQ